MLKGTLAMGIKHTMAEGRPIITAAGLGAALLGLLAGSAGAAPAAVALAEQDLTQLSLQELLDVQVTSVSKHAEPLRHAAAAITVVTGEDLRRTGTRTLAQALRLVPGLQVYRTNAHNYTVTSRGFSGDKLEVLVDGRSVYSPLNSTVFWDVLETSLTDVDRIEVIRGPGGTLWGANAVNGVINIVTKPSKDTVGNSLRLGGGEEEEAYGTFRGGSAIGDDGHARFFAKAVERDASVQRDGRQSFDAQRLAMAGFRSDWSTEPGRVLTVSGDFYDARTQTEDINPAVFARAEDAAMDGANLLSRFTYQPGERVEVSMQAYYDRYHRDLPSVYEEWRDTADVQGQVRFPLFDATITTGAGYRVTRDDTAGPPAAIIFEPASRRLETFSAFGQGELELGRGVDLTVGTKLEHNPSTGFELQPGARVGWEVTDTTFLWAAVSRAVRLPNRLDEDIAIFCTPAIAGILGCTPNTTLRIGSREIEAEKVIAYEWGARTWAAKDLTADFTAFYNRYTDLRSTETSPPPIGSFANRVEADSYGAELAVGWTPAPGISVRPFYSFLYIDAEADAGSTDAFTADNLEGSSPRHSAGLHLALNPWPTVTVDGFLRHVGKLERTQVPEYTELNFRLGWRALPSVELALVGADLLDSSHAEAGSAPSASNPSPNPPQFEVERAVWVDVLWTWR